MLRVLALSEFLPGLAKELLDTNDEMLDITTAKIKKLFRVALAMAASTGRTSPECYAALLPLRLIFKAASWGVSFGIVCSSFSVWGE